MHRKLIAPLFIAAALLSSSALASVPKMVTPAPDQIVEMPIKGMLTVLANTGELVFMSKNGRYIFRGTVTDAWQKKELTTIEAIKASAHSIPLARLGIQVDELDPLVMGTGPVEVVVITDPTCSVCKLLLEDMEEVSDKYTFKIFALPALGGKSPELTKKIACTKDRGRALQALIDAEVADLATPENCNLDAFMKANAMADLIGIDAVPFIISEDGRTLRGRPKNLDEWLSEDPYKPAQAKPISSDSQAPPIPASSGSGADTSLKARILNGIRQE